MATCCPFTETERACRVLAITNLLNAGVGVVCCGGGGIPVIRDSDGHLQGIEAVIDKDRTAALLAELLGADALLLLTNVSAVEVNFGTPSARELRSTTVDELRQLEFPAGSMGPKVEAACDFVQATGHDAAIGRLEDASHCSLERKERSSVGAHLRESWEPSLLDDPPKALGIARIANAGRHRSDGARAQLDQRPCNRGRHSTDLRASTTQ